MSISAIDIALFRVFSTTAKYNRTPEIMYQHTVTLRSLRDREKKQRVVVRSTFKDYTSIVFRVREDYPDLLRTHEIRGVLTKQVR